MNKPYSRVVNRRTRLCEQSFFSYASYTARPSLAVNSAVNSGWRLVALAPLLFFCHCRGPTSNRDPDRVVRPGHNKGVARWGGGLFQGGSCRVAPSLSRPIGNLPGIHSGTTREPPGPPGIRGNVRPSEHPLASVRAYVTTVKRIP